MNVLTGSHRHRGDGCRARADLRASPTNGWDARYPYLRSRPMAGSQTLRLRGGGFAAALAVLFLTFAGLARAQYPSPPSPPAAMPAREFRRSRRHRSPAGGDAHADDRPPTLVLPRRGTGGDPGSRWGSSTRSPSRSSASPIRTPGGRCRSRRSSARAGTRPGCRRPAARAAHPAGLDQCRGRQPVPAVVLHVRPGVQRPPEGQRLPRRLHDLDAAEPSPGADHEHPLRAPQQRRQRPAHHRPRTSRR